MIISCPERRCKLLQLLQLHTSGNQYKTQCQCHVQCHVQVYVYMYVSCVYIQLHVLYASLYMYMYIIHTASFSASFSPPFSVTSFTISLSFLLVCYTHTHISCVHCIARCIQVRERLRSTMNNGTCVIQSLQVKVAIGSACVGY